MGGILDLVSFRDIAGLLDSMDSETNRSRIRQALDAVASPGE